jgi:hypothetical protein
MLARTLSANDLIKKASNNNNNMSWDRKRESFENTKKILEF